MKAYVLLLRGINVGGHRKLLMADLKSLLTKLGLYNVQTYIQSGNVVFQTETEIKISELETRVAKQIHTDYGYDVPIIVISSEKLKSIIDKNPFSEANNIKNLHCTFFKAVPDSQLINYFNSLSYKPDSFLVTNDVLYLCCGSKFTDTKISHTLLEKELKVSCTTRNWKTTQKLLEMVTVLIE